MKQMTGLDAAFLHMESAGAYGHVNGLSIYEYPTPDFDPYEAVLDRIGSLIGHLEPLRRRVVEVPFGLDHPYWIDDPQFDLSYHVRQIGIARPGTDEQLAEQVARIIGRRMDRRHPLWEIYVMEGLESGQWALLSKFHHATVDGAAGVIMLRLMTGTSPDEPWPYEPVDWVGEPIPSEFELVRRAIDRLMRNPVRATRLGLGFVRDLADSAGVTTIGGMATRARDMVTAIAGRSEAAEQVREQIRRVTIPMTIAPPTPWNGSIGPHRRFAMRSTHLSNIKALKDAIGGTVNDVVMAICAGALREYLIRHDALPEEPLRAMVPVSVRTGKEDDPWTNRVTSIFAELPTNVADPIERVRSVREAMEVAKQQLDLVPADTIMQATDITSPVLATAAVRFATRLAERVTPPVNVVISNVPGPREALYFAGAKLDQYIPVSTIATGVGLNITVHSYENRLDFGLVADRELVPDLWDLVDLHVEEMGRLFDAIGIEWVIPPEPTPDRKEPAAVRIAAPHAAAEPPKRSSPKTTPARKAPARATAAKKAPAKKTAAKKTAAKKTAATRAPAKKAAASRS